MSDTAIKIENLSKQYRLGAVGTGTLTHDLKRWWAKVRGKEDPTLQIGMENKLAEAGGEYVYALKDINLDVKQGDILGVIGKNGAGKSTLLKILSRVTAPTTGTVDMVGRVASLLEVGTGFHPELTGKENIFLNGAIMGMTRKEIKSHFDEIVDFSGVGKYIDTPVKRYSSGMYVRLAFAVSAYLEHEILLVDEVLAVGDAEFQKKAIGKMQDVSRNEGRTVLFVSHNMAAVRALCNKGAIMSNGYCSQQGSIEDCVNEYLELNKRKTTKIMESIELVDPSITINSLTVNGDDTNSIYVSPTSNVLNFEIEGFANQDMEMSFELRLTDIREVPLAIYSPGHFEGGIKKYQKGNFIIKNQVVLPANMNCGTFIVSLFLTYPNEKFFMKASNCLQIISEGLPNRGMILVSNNDGFLIL